MQQAAGIEGLAHGQSVRLFQSCWIRRTSVLYADQSRSWLCAQGQTVVSPYIWLLGLHAPLHTAANGFPPRIINLSPRLSVQWIHS